MTKAKQETGTAVLDKPLEPERSPSSEEIEAKIGALEPKLAEVDAEDAQLSERQGAVAVLAHSNGDAAALKEFDELSAKRFVVTERRKGIEMARTQLEAELEDASQAERAAERLELRRRLEQLDDEIEPARTDVSAAISEFATKAWALRALLMNQAHLQRELTIKQGIAPDRGETWEVLERVLHGVAEELAAKANGAAVPIGRSEGDYLRGLAAGRKAAQAEAERAATTPAAGERAN